MQRSLKYIAYSLAGIWMTSIVFLYFCIVHQQTGPCPPSGWCFLSYAIEVRQSHSYYIDAIRDFVHSLGTNTQSPLVNIVLALLLIWIIVIGVTRFTRKEESQKIKLSPLLLLVLFSLTFFLIAYNWFSYYQLIAVTAPYSGIIVHYFWIVVSILLISLAAGACGLKILKLFLFPSVPSLICFLLSLGLGTMFLTFLLFVLGLCGMLNEQWVWGVMIILTVLCYKESWQWIKAFFTPQITYEFRLLDPKVFLVVFFFIILGHNLLEVIRPMPIGFDDLGYYMNVPKLIAQGGTLLSGTDSYAWGIFMSLGFLLFHSPIIAMVFSLLGGIFVFFSLFALIKFYCLKREVNTHDSSLYALLGATLFYSLPAVIFQSAKDMKVDLAAMFFSILAILTFFHWKEKGNNTPLRYLFLSGLFLGSGFSIKYTSLFLFMSLFVIILITVKRGHLRDSIGGYFSPIDETGIAIDLYKRVITSSFLIFIIGFVIPISPYVIKNALEAKEISIQSIRIGKIQSPSIALNPPLDLNNTGIGSQTVTAPTSSGVYEELGRYSGYMDGITKYLLLPFTITFNPLVSGMYVDIGYIFLAFIPLLFLFFIFPSSERKKDFFFLFALGGGFLYWVLWGAFAQGVIWYGFSGFAFLLLLIVEVWNFLKKYSPQLTFLTNVFCILWFINILFLRTASLPQHAIIIDPLGVTYARGILNENLYFTQKIPTYLQITAIINKDITEHPTDPPYIYRVGTFIKYFIEKNNLTVLDDHQLDTFTFIHQDKDDLKTIERFQRSGFKYMIIDTNTATIDKTPEQSLSAKYNELLRFIKGNPEHIHIIIDEPQNGILFAQIE